MQCTRKEMSVDNVALPRCADSHLVPSHVDSDAVVRCKGSVTVVRGVGWDTVLGYVDSVTVLRRVRRDRVMCRHWHITEVCRQYCSAEVRRHY